MSAINPFPNVVQRALENEQVRRLYEEVNGTTPITFTPSSSRSWSSASSANKTAIEFVECKYPSEALAHELLHAKLKAQGYRQYTFAVAKAPCPQKGMFPEVLRILDNELQHIKTAPMFAGLSLDLRRFYHDDDVNAVKKVRRAVEKMGDRTHPAVVFTQFVTLLAPGGAPSALERQQAIHFMQAKCGPRTWLKLERIQRAFEQWREDASLDARATIETILEALEVGCSAWIGASANFPGDGFFVGAPFELSEADVG